MTTNGLKAMFWKECRENARWAVLALLALSLGLAYAWFHLYQQSSFPSLGQIWSGENLVLTITTPLIGLALGLLQILPELRRDQWAFLVHRPASRTTLFFGKVLPGVCLYLLATILPLLGLAAWAASPSHVPAPFDFRFTLAGWAAILSGLPFYFAGLLVALRPARWYGSRTLPLLTALLAPFAAYWQEEFWQVALSCALVTASLLLAAWGSFLTSGQYGGQPRPARFGLGLTLFAGIAVAVIGLTVFCNLMSQSLFSHGRMRAPITVYGMNSHGRIIRTTYYNADGSVRYADQNGKPLPPAILADFYGGADPLIFVQVASPFAQAGEREKRYNMPQRYVAPLQTFLYHFEDTAWFYLYDQAQAVGYSLRTHRVVGYLGPRGFADTSNDAGRFPEPLLGSIHRNNTAGLLLFERSAYGFSMGTQTVRKVWASPGSASLDGSCYLTAPDDAKSSSEAIILAAGHRFHVLSGAGQPLFTTPYAPDAASRPFITVSTVPRLARFFFWYSADGLGNSRSASQVVTVSPRGRVLNTVTLPALQSPPLYQTPSAAGLLVPPAANAAGLGAMLHDRWFGDTQQRKTRNPLAQDAGLRGLLLLSALMGLVSAATAWLISRRLGDGRRGQIAWALGVFWLGGYGVLLLLALRAWPARVPCPHCGRQRVVDNETCEHCGAAFARPKRDGTEIFDAEGREAAAR